MTLTPDEQAALDPEYENRLLARDPEDLTLSELAFLAFGPIPTKETR